MADVVNHTNATSTAEVQQYLTNSLQELQTNVQLDGGGVDWFLQCTVSAAVTAGTATYLITAGSGVSTSHISIIKGVDVSFSADQWYPATPATWADRNAGAESPEASPNVSPGVRYHVFSRPLNTSTTYIAQRTYLRFVPSPSQAFRYRVWFVPEQDISTVTKFILPPLWDEFIVVDSAAKVLERDEQDTQHLLMRKARLERTILLSSDNKDLGSPEQVNDTNRFYDGD
jgi:hypothetical protein